MDFKKVGHEVMIRLVLISLLLVGCANKLMYNIGTEENPVWTYDQEEAVNSLTVKTCNDLVPDIWASPEQREYYINVASFAECYNDFKPMWRKTFQQIAKERGADESENNADLSNAEGLSNTEKLNCSYIRGRYNTEREKARQRTAQARSYMARANSTRDQYAKNNLIAKSNQALAQARYANSKATNYKNRHNRSGCEPRIY